jgi:hypothetical protein
MTNGTVTHTAYVLQRETRARSRWLEIGDAFIESDGPNGTHHIHLNRIPIGGFSGNVVLHPKGESPPDPQAEPERPGESVQG